jgi:1-acyl-sn-glycerol-3-phosphate acyltransferase
LAAKADPVGDSPPFFYRLVRRSFRIVARPMFRFAVEGALRVPTSGPVILVAPHRSWLDPPCLAAACQRHVRFLIMEKIYAYRCINRFYAALQAIPVKLGDGVLTLSALRESLRALGAGTMIGIFPEGRVVQGERMGSMHRGAALLALRSGAVVVPVAIDGSARAWPRGRRWPAPSRVRVRFGDPLRPPQSRNRGETDRFTDAIRAALDRLIDDGQAR